MSFFITPTEMERERARTLVLQYGWNTMSYQILNPGISLWFSDRTDAVVGYVETGSHFIVAGSLVAAVESLDEIILELYASTSTRKKKICFFGAQERIAEVLSNKAPVSTILLGAQPMWKPQTFLRTIRTKQSLRAQINRARNKGIEANIVQANEDVVNELHRVLTEWLGSKRLPPMHFLVEPNTLDVLQDRIIVAAAKKERIVGFCIASPIPLRNGWLIEQIVRGNDAPNGTTELMLESMITHLHASDADIITLGLSPLSRQFRSNDHKLYQPLWLHLLLNLTRYYGRLFYNFDGLDSFKAKFIPDTWEPVYAMTNENHPTLSTLYAIATVFSGMSPVRFVLKGLMRRLTLK